MTSWQYKVRREPDVILPKSDDRKEVRLWIKENVFCLVSTFSNSKEYLNHIKANHKVYKDCIDYLEYTASLSDGERRRDIAAQYLMDRQIEEVLGE